MNQTVKLLGTTLLGAAMLIACGDDTTGGGGSGAGDTGGGGGDGGNPTTGGGGTGGDGGTGGTGGMPGFPAIPEFSTQIDRMGRPAINTALSGAFVQFNAGGMPVAANAADRALIQDGYNSDDQQNTWLADYVGLFGANLAVLDSLDTGVDPDGAGPAGVLTNAQACTNQPASCGVVGMPACYNPLGAILTQDFIWVRTDGVDGAGACSAVAPAALNEGYLAVELNGSTLSPNSGCGGRRPVDDTIAFTYSVVSGTFGYGFIFDDNIAARNGQHPETFPYMAPPQ